MADRQDNLIPQAHVLTVDELSKGGQNSAEARRRKRDIRSLTAVLFPKRLTDFFFREETFRELTWLIQISEQCPFVLVLARRRELPLPLL